MSPSVFEPLPEWAIDLLDEAFDERGRKLVSVVCGAGRKDRCRRELAVVWEMPGLDYALFETPPFGGGSRSASISEQLSEVRYRRTSPEERLIRREQGKRPPHHTGYLAPVPLDAAPPLSLFTACGAHPKLPRADLDPGTLVSPIRQARKNGTVVETYAYD